MFDRRALPVLFLILFAPSVYGQATRTWVSGVGDDVNPCSRTAPCKTFAGAISKTAAGGEINAIDPGGYGAVTITKSMTIDGAGTMASILFAGSSGVIINSPGISVTIRNVSLNGGGTGTNGIRILAAAHVAVENVEIFNFTARGISDERTVAGTLTVLDSVVRNATPGFTAHGIVVLPSSGSAAHTFRASRVRVFATTHTGLYLANGVNATVTDSSFHANTHGVALQNGLSPVTAILDRVEMTSNTGDGLRVLGVVTARLSDTTIVGNGTNGILFSGGSVESFGTNSIRGNTGNNGAGIITVPLQ